MFRKIDRRFLFLSGILVLCLSVILYHMEPVDILADNLGDWLQLLVLTIWNKPPVWIGIVIGSIFLVAAIRKAEAGK